MAQQRSSSLSRIMLGAALPMVTLVSLLGLWIAHASAETPSPAPTWGWQMPQHLSNSNTTVTFEVDSTWHLIKGTTSRIDGRVWLADTKDPLSVRALVKFPVDAFATGGESRDERMREVMDSEHVPLVTLSIDSFEPRCALERFQSRVSCPVTLAARLSIRGVEKPLTLTGNMVRAATDVVLSGETRFSWADFGVEDPSILVAKLDPEVLVSYTVRLPVAGPKEE